jgi:pimeloyl-ACP methyl ester carboxylesterase
MSLLSALPSRQSFTTSTGNTYSYLYILPTGPKKPTLLFLHGFPSHIADWIYQLTYFSRLGYGVVALDLLGYGQSSKPTEINVFRLKAMSDELLNF